MPKIYLSPAAHEHDRKCAYSASCSENTHANLYIDQLTPYLDACGIQWKRAPKTNTGAKNADTIRESNAYKPDIHYVAHTNAFDGTVKGSRLGVYWPDAKSRQWGQTVIDWRKKIYPYPAKITDGSKLAEVNSTTAVALYEELIFHDNAEDAKWFHEHLRQLAEYTCRAFCQLFGIPFVDPYESKPEPDKTVLYKVQVGAFANKANADKLAAELKAKGYQAYVKSE